MIQKIISIRSVGKITDYRLHDNVALKKLSLFFAENGRGKTTLVTILRSLRDNDPKPIVARRTLGATAKPSVSLLVDGRNITFDEVKGWTESASNFEVFDDSFVSENVYSGNAVEIEQRKKLYNFALGNEGVVLSANIASLDTEGRVISAKIQEIIGRIQISIPIGLDIEKYLAMPEIADIDNQISEKEKDLDILRDVEQFLSKEQFATVELPALPDCPEITRLLAMDVERLTADIERLVQLRISGLGEGAEPWIEKGLEYAVDSRCPFCGQNVSQSQLISAYRTFFGEEYKRLKSEISAALDVIEGVISDETALEIQKAIQANAAANAYWCQIISVGIPAINFDDLHSNWKTVARLTYEHLLRKQASPLEHMDPDRSLVDAMELYENSRTKVCSYNRAIDEANLLISEKKKKVAASSLESIRNELERLITIRKRHLEPNRSLCSEYAILNAEKRKQEAQKEKAKADLHRYSSEILGKYQSRINRYLRNFGAEFSIVGSDDSFKGKEPSLEYSLCINGKSVRIQEKNKTGTSACFSNTLSAGDRSTLGFAFFLARLDLDPKVGEKIVILDDPISSLDYFRVTCTSQEIGALIPRAQQVIVLSHDAAFLKRVMDYARETPYVALQIRRRATGSDICEFDLERATQSEYLLHFSMLSRYCENGPEDNTNTIGVIRIIRPLLETYLRFRFPNAFPSGIWLGTMIRQIRECGSDAPLAVFKSALSDLDAINAYTSPYHHDLDDMTPTPSDAELKSYLQRTLKIVSS